MRETKTKQQSNSDIFFNFLSKFSNVQVVAGYHAADMPQFIFIIANRKPSYDHSSTQQPRHSHWSGDRYEPIRPVRCYSFKYFKGIYALSLGLPTNC